MQDRISPKSYFSAIYLLFAPMKKHLQKLNSFFLLSALCLLFLLACEGDSISPVDNECKDFVSFEEKMPTEEKLIATEIIYTSDAHMVIIGTRGYTQTWVRKLSLSGELIWESYIKASSWFSADIVETQDHGFALTSTYGGEIYLAKLDSLGNKLWSRTYSNASVEEYGQYLIQTQDNGFLMLGGCVNPDDSPSLFLVKTDQDGNDLWKRTLRHASANWAKDLIECADGSYAILGHTNGLGSGGFDIWLSKLDVSGGLLWERAYGSDRHEISGAVIQLEDNGFMIIGEDEGSGDGILITTDESGYWLTTRIDKFATSKIIPLKKEKAFILLGTQYPAPFEGDIWLQKIDQDGQLIWDKTYGEAGVSEISASIVAIENCGLGIVGNYTTSQSPSKKGIYLLKMDNEGETL